MNRGQSHVVGVALVLAITVIALGTVTTGIGAVFDAQASSVDANRVAGELDATLQPVERTGPNSGHVAFSDGRLTTVERQLRVLRDGSVVAEVDADALVFTANDRRVAFVGGAIVRGTRGNGWLAREPPLAASDDGGVIAVSAPKLNASHQSVSGGGRARLSTNVSHQRSALGRGTFSVAIETTRPNAFERYFEREGVSTNRRDFDGDGIESVVAEYPGTRRGYLVVHDMRLEVG